MNHIKVIEASDKSVFENECNKFIEEGYTVSSTSCGFVNSEEYNFASVYQAILIKARVA